MARFRPIDDSPNERAPGPNWGSQVLEAYRDDANRAIANREFELTMQQRGMENATDIAMRLQYQAAQEQAQEAAFKQQKEMENLRTRNDIWKEREQYNFQANKELERIRTARREIALKDWPENIKVQANMALDAQEMGIKSDPINFAPKPPPASEQWAESRVIDKENGIVSYRQPDGKWEVKPLPTDKATKPGGIDDKTLKANQDQIDKAETAIKNEMTLKGEDPAKPIPDTVIYDRVIRNLKRAGAPEETIAPWRQRLTEAKAGEAPAQDTGGLFGDLNRSLGVQPAPASQPSIPLNPSLDVSKMEMTDLLYRFPKIEEKVNSHQQLTEQELAILQRIMKGE